MGTARLHLTTSVEEQWRSVVGPWLRKQAHTAWKNPQPTVVLTPSRAEGFYLRSRLVAENIPFLGIRFWTPSDARQYLRAELSPGVTPVTQADLRLFARGCAEKLLQAKNPPDAATLASLEQEPGAFLRAYDLLTGAGWNPERDGPSYGRLPAKELARELKKLKLATQAEVHRRLLEQSAGAKAPLLANLLMTGFNATHWPLWDLLRTVVFLAVRAEVVLSAPRVFGEEVDQLWISSWEEAVGVSAGIPESGGEGESPFAGLAASYERGGPGGMSAAEVNFLLTPDLMLQVRAIVLQAVDYLRRESCTRLGIVFPEADALALAVGEELRRMQIPLDDGTGAIQPGFFERRFWSAWLALQREPSVRNLISWLRACEAQGIPCGIENTALSAREISSLLENVLGESLVDDLDFLSRHLEESSSRTREGAVADFLRKRIQLPETTSFAEFLEETRKAFHSLQWEGPLAWLESRALAAFQENKQVISRRTFLAWLEETADSRERTRGEGGNHFYGKVHLLIYAQMTGQTWSHLILTGLNEGVWPRLYEAGAFGSRHELAALNQQARELNRQGREQGGQGSGHEIMRGNRGHCLLPLERHALALRDLCAALEGTTEAVCLTALTSEGGRNLLPSDFFNHACQAQTGLVPDEDFLRDMAESTVEWCKRHESILQPSPALGQKIAATRIAYNERRDASKPFGPYEFAFAELPVEPVQLSCKTWETAWNHPASVWLEHVVGVAPWPEGKLSWPRAIGTWVHRWLTAALRACADQNSSHDFLRLLEGAIDSEMTRIQQRARAAGRELYPWWGHVAGEAKSMTLGLGRMLSPELPGKRLLSEFRLPENIEVALPGSSRADFALTGRIDLVLIEGPLALNESQIKNGDFSGCACWVIDFKTGNASKLSPSTLEKGRGIQPLLYALAIRARGARSVMISLGTPDAALQPQMSVEAALEIESLFLSLERFHRAGVFGMRAQPEGDYAYSPDYPMATRFIPGNILEVKWALTHGTPGVKK